MKPSDIAREALRITNEHRDHVQWDEFDAPMEHNGTRYEFDALHDDSSLWEVIRQPVGEWPEGTKAEVPIHICGIVLRNSLATVDEVMRASVGLTAREALGLGGGDRFEPRGGIYQTWWLQDMIETRDQMERSG